MRRESEATFALASLTTATAVKLGRLYKHSVKLALAEADDRGETIIRIALYAIPCPRAVPKFDVYHFFFSNESNRPTNKEDTVLRRKKERERGERVEWGWDRRRKWAGADIISTARGQ